MAQPVYATLEDLREFIGKTPPSSIGDAQLREASEVVDEILLTAIYRTNAEGVAACVATRDAIRDATCAQALHTDEYGSESELAAQGGAVSLGPLSLPAINSGGSKGSGGGVGPWSPRAIRILRGQGLIVGPVLS